MVNPKTKQNKTKNESRLPILKRATSPSLQIYVVAQERQSHATSCQGCKQRHFFHHPSQSQALKDCLFNYPHQQPVFIFGTVAGNWETQSVQERKRSSLSHQRKSVPKRTIQQATVRRTAESKTITQHRSPKVPDTTVPRKSHLGVRGSPGSFSPAPHLPIPAADSEGPGPKQRRALGPKKGFPKG